MDNYIVSARKYRPATFDTVVGQSALTTTLKNAIAQGKLAHAYLFCGPRGVGKTTCARIFARTINCLSPTASGEACNECESCRAFNEQRSYNIHELDAASNNSVEDIRNLIDQVQIPPQVGRYKVFIIDEVHMLSQAAFNAFLKTLEEPPAHAIFILATTEKHKILPTILSRCQIYDFSRISVADIVAHLSGVAEKEGIKYEPEALHVIAEKADGGMRDALSVFDQVASFTEGDITYKKVIEDLNVLDSDEYFGTTDELLRCDIPAAMVRFNRILSHGFEGNYFIGGLAAHLRNLLMTRDEATLPLLEVSETARERYREQAARCKPKWLYRVLRLCNDCDLAYRASRNKRLLVELTLIEAAQEAADDGEGCGRRPIRRLKPIFKHTAAPQRAAAAPAPAMAQPVAAHTTQSGPQSAAPAAPAAAPAAPAKARHTAHTISIRSLRAGYGKGQQASPAAEPDNPAQGGAAQTAAPAGTRLETPFDEKELSYYWYRFAQSLPQEESATAGRLKNMKPVLLPGWTVEAAVDNEIVEDYIHRIQARLVAYLRTQLRNDHIQLSLRLVETTENTRAYSRLEQLNDMMRRNPALAQLQKELQLELS